jgi:hypothetical protein
VPYLAVLHEMNDQTKAAFASAADCAKQLITLATAILTLEVAFAKNILETPSLFAKIWMVGSWMFFLVSVLAGMWTMLALTGSLGASTPPTPQTINSKHITAPAMAQIFLFLCGLFFTFLFGLTAIK